MWYFSCQLGAHDNEIVQELTNMFTNRDVDLQVGQVSMGDLYLGDLHLNYERLFH